ncbi:MAG TPA: hypothetical protein VGR57_02230 [Ktedonobacterales bacterium]|nr:hypothetical protein [Ktedonobacterales bacterium]
MAFPGRGQGGLADTNNETGLAEVLLAFVTYGGQLGGARRLADNPLALTHVRWLGAAGQFLDAVRRPADDGILSTAEREAWLRLALHYPETPVPVPSGPSAPWLPLTIEREAAQSINALLMGTRMSDPSASRSQFPRRPEAEADAFASSHLRTGSTPGPQFSNAISGGRVPGGFGIEARNGQTNSWQYAASEPREFAALPCVEVELPRAHSAPAADYARDYARDVAIHFARAAQALPQVRETRAWMRDDRLVLAARMVLGNGTRPLTRADLDGAAQMLSDELARRTIPYIRLTFADPLEWDAGSPMPE